ncbi:MAG: hypothetical protein IJT70_02040 [Clostridia bacterium]|nr:hypothetical protein [Clostridia bacterium]
MNFDSIPKEWMNTNQRAFYRSLYGLLKPEDKVCVIPFFFDGKIARGVKEWDELWGKEDGAYYHMIVDPLISLKIKEENVVFINHVTDTKEVCAEKIKRSSVILLPGGLPRKMTEEIDEYCFGNASVKTKKIVIGYSEGYMVRFRRTTPPNEDPPTFADCTKYARVLGVDVDWPVEGIRFYRDSILKCVVEAGRRMFALKSGAVVTFVREGKIRTFSET